MTPRPRGGVPLEVTQRHLRMAHRMLARRGFYQGSTVDYEDHFGACLLGLAKAVKRFDPSMGVAFDTYAYRRMSGEHLDYLRTLDHLTRGERRAVREGRAIDPGPWAATVPAPPDTPDPRDDYARVRLAGAIDEAAGSLSEKEAVVLRLCGLHDWTQEDVGMLLGVSAARVSQLGSSAREKLRDGLVDMLADAA